MFAKSEEHVMDHVDSGVIFFQGEFVSDETVITVPLICISTNTIWDVFAMFELTNTFVDIFER
jgi:hypothetical protein